VQTSAKKERKKSGNSMHRKTKSNLAHGCFGDVGAGKQLAGEEVREMDR
jgi:hypothetical protein